MKPGNQRQAMQKLADIYSSLRKARHPDDINPLWNEYKKIEHYVTPLWRAKINKLKRMADKKDPTINDY